MKKILIFSICFLLFIPCIVAQDSSKRTFPFTKEQNSDNAMFVWFIYKQSRFDFDYLPAKQFPTSKHFTIAPNNEPQAGDVAWTSKFMGIFAPAKKTTEQVASSPAIITAESTIPVKTFENKFGPIKYFRYIENTTNK